MKRLVFAAALSFAAFAFADTVSGTDTYGVLKIADDTHATVVVCVPWIGVDDSAIKVSDLIMTSNRKAGDVLYYYDKSGNGAYRAWVLAVNPVTGARTWDPTTSVTSGGVTPGAAAADQAAARGDALIIVRCDNESIAAPVYLYGKYSGTPVSTAITAGSPSIPVYNLIAPPNGTEDCNMNTITAKGIGGEGKRIDDKDRIIINNSTHQYRYVNGNWGYYDLSDPTNPSFQSGLTIPAGEGAWYISKGGNPTFTW